MKAKKQLAAKIMKTSPKKVNFAVEHLEEIKKAITRSDMRGLIAVGKISKSKANHQSRARARKIAIQKSKGRRKGKGSRKGSKFSIISRKEQWMARVRVQRVFLRELKDKQMLSTGDYRNLYSKVKGGYFRNRRHIKLYLTERNLVQKKDEGKSK